MTVTSIDIDSDKLEQLKRITRSRTNRETVDLALDIALGVQQKRDVVSRIAAHGYTPDIHEATKHGAPRPA